MVASAAARAIARRKDEKTFAHLCDLARAHPLNGLAAALSSFRGPEAIPILIGALGEDEVRQTGLGLYAVLARIIELPYRRRPLVISMN